MIKKRLIAGLRQRGVPEEQLQQQEDLTQVRGTGLAASLWI